MCTFAGVFETVVTAQRELPKQHGEMPEWSNGAVSKTVDLLGGPRVRIPFSPPEAVRLSIWLLFFLSIGRQLQITDFEMADVLFMSFFRMVNIRLFEPLPCSTILSET